MTGFHRILEISVLSASNLKHLILTLRRDSWQSTFSVLPQTGPRQDKLQVYMAVVRVVSLANELPPRLDALAGRGRWSCGRTAPCPSRHRAYSPCRPRPSAPFLESPEAPVPVRVADLLLWALTHFRGVPGSQGSDGTRTLPVPTVSLGRGSTSRLCFSVNCSVSRARQIPAACDSEKPRK